MRRGRDAPHGSRWAGVRRLADGLLALGILALLMLVAARLDRVATLTLEGLPLVHDGDTITLGGERIRLKGIDAPELAQICAAGGRHYPCGRRAREALVALVGGGAVSCSGWERDRYGRLLGACVAARGTELNRLLVEQGWALAYGGYEDAERVAKDAAAGLWAGSFDRPRDWRVQHGALADFAHGFAPRIANWFRQVFRWP